MWLDGSLVGHREVITYFSPICYLQVTVLFAGQHISKSPFEVNVDKAQGDASKVTAKGPGLEAVGNIANKPTYFDIYTAGNVPLLHGSDLWASFQRLKCYLQELEGLTFCLLNQINNHKDSVFQMCYIRFFKTSVSSLKYSSFT